MTIKRTFFKDQFRNMCITHQFCNACTNTEYSEVFDWIEEHKDDASDENIIELAVMVADLTSNDDFNRMGLVKYIGFTIMEECVVGFIEMEEPHVKSITERIHDAYTAINKPLCKLYKDGINNEDTNRLEYELEELHDAECHNDTERLEKIFAKYGV